MSTVARDIPSGNNAYQVGPAEFEFPFLSNGDAFSFVITRHYKQTVAGYLADRLAPKNIPGVDVDPTYSDAYLIAEEAPQPTPTGLYRFTRTFARIPAQQTVPTSLFVTKPDISSLGTLHGILNDYTDPTVQNGGLVLNGESGDVYEYSSRYFGGTSIFSLFTGTSTVTAVSGGTFTLTYKTSTTASLNWNDSGATIAAALNGLASVSGESLTFSVTNSLTDTTNPRLALTLTAGTTSTGVTLASSLTPTAAATVFSYVQSLTTQSLRVAARVTLTSHGFDSGENLLVYQLNSANSALSIHALLPPSTMWSVIDANTVAFLPVADHGTAYTGFGQRTGGYAAGTVLTRAKRVTDFYLPGVSAGIGTMDDVPLPTYQGDANSLLAAIIAGSTSINYEVGEIAQWRGSPILARTITTLNAATL